MSGPCLILAANGKPGPGCQRIPPVAVPEERHPPSFAAWTVRERRPLAISSKQAQEYGRRGAAASKRKAPG